MYRQEDPEINFDQVLERIRDFLKRFGMGGGGSLAYIVLGVLAVALVIWLATGIFTVQPGEQAAVRLFGEFDSLQDEGLHWWWPTPIGARDIVRTDEVRRLELGVRGDTTILTESLMITGDVDEAGNPGEAPNIVDVQLRVQYDIKDIENFLYRAVDPGGVTIKDASETALRQVVGSRPIDDVLTDKKEEVQEETKLLLQGLLDLYETGIRVREVKLQNVFAPEQVKDAFDDVVRAKEDKARIINLADAYKEDVLPRARGYAAKQLQDAEAFRQQRIALSTGEAEKFLAILREFRKAPDVTRQRLYLEAMEQILPGIQKIIGDPSKVIVTQSSASGQIFPVPE
ncbi:MAG: FtsH protease activity modulator HflK [Chloroflexi bacterium]|nr:FtsH protease activity modulator HflK [Chloroflexota bacterium]